VLAAADKELIGKTLSGNGIKFEVSEQFYKGEEITAKELAKMLHEFGNINLVGEKVVAVALGEKLAGESQILEIEGVKHLQIIAL
jgi:hypothetical protein